MLESVLGWVGTAGTLGAYLMLSRGRLTATSTTYALLNVVGGLLAGVASASVGAWPSVTANVLWAAISLRTLMVALRRPGAVVIALPRRRPPVLMDREAARRSVHLRIPA